MAERDSYKHGEFCWVDYMAADMEVATKFYQQLFNWQLVEEYEDAEHRYAIFTHNEKGVAGLGEMDEAMKAHGVPPAWNSYINVDDVDVITQRAQELGATLIMAPLDAADTGRMSIVQDPTGAQIFFWQKVSHSGAELVNSPNSFCWNELITRDIDKAKEFYGQLLGWEFAAEGSDYLMINNQGEMNGGIKLLTEEIGDIPSHWSVYFAVADIKLSVESVKKQEGNIYVEPFDIGFGHMAVVSDNQLGVFNLFQFNEQQD